MPYVNIPETGLDSSIARLIGKLKGEFTNRIQKGLQNIKQQFSSGCPSQQQLENIITQLDNLKRLGTDISDRLNRIRKLIKPLKDGATAITTTVTVLKALPIPGLALTAGVTTTFSDLLHLVKEFGTQLKTSATSIESLLDQTNILSNLVREAENTTQKIETALEFCQLSNQTGLELPAECINKIVNGSREEVNKCISDLNRLLDSQVGSNTLTQAVDSIANSQNQEITNEGREAYTASNGISYEIVIKQIQSDFTKAPKRQAIALAPGGKIIATSDKSFSSSIEVLKRQVKFRIDNSQV